MLLFISFKSRKCCCEREVLLFISLIAVDEPSFRYIEAKSNMRMINLHKSLLNERCAALNGRAMRRRESLM